MTSPAASGSSVRVLSVTCGGGVLTLRIVDSVDSAR